MPVIPPASRVLVTGASGFLGVHVIKALVDGGFSVRGAVRSTSKGEYLKKLFGSKFEAAVVEDMQKADAYDKAVVGVDAIVHTATIMTPSSGDPDLIIKPAVAGTVGVLESAKKFGTNSVKRVIITSSMGAVGGGITDDSTWNQAAVDNVKSKGAESSWFMQYAASKVLAERAAWDFIGQNKADISFDISTICPPWIIGPMLHEGSDVASINGSVKFVLNALDPKNLKTGDALINKEGGYIDARDTASIIVQLLLAPAAENERFITMAGPFSYQMVYDAVNESPAFDKMPVGEPGKKGHFYCTAKTDKLLGVLGRTHEEVFRPFNASVRDTLKGGMERGWAVTND